jgi:protein TonB
MKRKNEKVPGFDEIIFENRNKKYGAYDLRRRYLPTTCFSILGGAAFFAALIFIISLSIEKKVTAEASDRVIVIIKPQSYFDPKEVQPPEPKKPEIISTLKNIRPEVVDDTSASITTFSTADELTNTVKNGNVHENDSVSIISDPVIPVEPEPVVFVKEMPEFPGGGAALLKFISENIIYPQEAAENGVHGRVILRFVVSSDGSVKRVEVLRSIHPILDTEAIRVVSKLPKWKPGKQNGIAVPVWFTVPVNFELKYN